METQTGPPAGLEIDGGDGREAIGATRVANEVVASIAALAALQVGGVHAMYQPAGHQIDRILRRAYAHRGVRVALVADELHLDLWVVIEAGGSVPVIGGEVQRRVADAVERMLGLRIAEVNVFVSEVIFR
jgi:uncharacterized alkaline shock family protein YloU